jgi:hypothetical protein
VTVLLGYLIGSTLDPLVLVSAGIAGMLVGSALSALIWWAALTGAIAGLVRYPASIAVAQELGTQTSFSQHLLLTAASVAMVMGLAFGLRAIRRGSAPDLRAGGLERARPTEDERLGD